MSAPEDLIRASKLDKTQVEQLRGSYQKALETPGAAGDTWHGFNDIQTMAGLGGQFLWPENPQAPVTVSFTNVTSPQQGVAIGNYTLATLAGVTQEQGNFIAIPNNPAIGYASIALTPTPQGANEVRGYLVQGMLTDDSNGAIINMLLENGSNQEFFAVRMSPPA